MNAPIPRRALTGLLIAGLFPAMSAWAQEAPPPQEKDRPRRTPCCTLWT